MKIKVLRNFVNIDAPFNLQYYKPGHPETQISSMGAVAKGTVSITYGNDVYTGDISQFDAWLISRGYISDSDFIQFDQYTDYVNLPQGFFITDPTGVNGCAQIKKYMRYADPHLDWYKTTFQHFGVITTVYLTEDHPLPVAYLDGTVTGDQEVVCEIEGMKFHRTPLNKIDQSKKVFGLMNIDGELIAAQLSFEIDPMYHAVGYDFETSTDRFVIKNIVSNNCRTRVIGNYYDPTRQIVPGRGNLFVVTINLPWLALETKESLKEGEDLYEKFMQDVDETIDACVDQLNDRFEMICKRTGKNFPFLVGQGVYLDSEKIGPNDSIREMIMHGTRTVGFIGLAETLQVLFGKHHGESEFAQEKGLEIISHMNTRITELAKKTNINYSFMGSPAEGCTGRLCRLLRKRFGVIPGITDKEYIVNSHHIRPDFPISAWDKVRIEAPYHALEPAGAISYIELDSDASKNVKAFEQLVNFMADSNMGYFSINHPVDRDPVCGYIGVIGDTCPRCGRREGEGVPAGKLMSLLAYSPDPIYAVRPHMLEEEEDDVVPNTLSSSEDFSIIE